MALAIVRLRLLMGSLAFGSAGRLLILCVRTGYRAVEVAEKRKRNVRSLNLPEDQFFCQITYGCNEP